jgi:MerR family transcriptional regulator, redox-sensitive transcriptional activator SoxR
VDNWHESGLTVGQVAQRMNISRSAVRWYDDHGLLPSERTNGNQRRFFADVCCRIAMIKAAQRVGLTIEEIRAALSALTPGQVPTPEEWERLAAELRNVVGRRIEDLFALLSELTPDQTPEPSIRSRDPPTPVQANPG